MQRRRPAQSCRIKILMCNNISPFIQFLQQFLPPLVPVVIRLHFAPEIEAEPPEVRSEIPGFGFPLSSFRSLMSSVLSIASYSTGTPLTM